jgi:hypothetical protein
VLLKVLLSTTHLLPIKPVLRSPSSILRQQADLFVSVAEAILVACGWIRVKKETLGELAYVFYAE